MIAANKLRSCRIFLAPAYVQHIVVALPCQCLLGATVPISRESAGGGTCLMQAFKGLVHTCIINLQRKAISCSVLLQRPVSILMIAL